MDKKLHSALRGNAKALDADPRAFCYIEDQGVPYLYIDRTQSNPTALGSLSSAATVMGRTGASVSFSKGGSLTAGTVVKTGGICYFSPTIVKGISEDTFKKGLKKFKAELVKAKVAGDTSPEEEPSSESSTPVESTPESVDVVALAKNYMAENPPTSQEQTKLTGYLSAQKSLPEALDSTEGKKALETELKNWRAERFLTRSIKKTPIEPETDTSLSVYLGRLSDVPDAIWNAASLLEPLFTKLRREASQAASSTASATPESVETPTPDHEDPTTWDIQPLEIKFNTSSVEAASDWENYRGQIERAELRSEHGMLRWSVPMHKHLQGGSWGISFIYRLDDRATGKVTPVIYDYATKRQDNDYVWERGGKTGGPSGASYS